MKTEDEGEYSTLGYGPSRDTQVCSNEGPPVTAPLSNKTDNFFRKGTGQKRKIKRGCRGGKQSHPQKKKKVTRQGIFHISGEELTKSEKITLNQGLKYALKKIFEQISDVHRSSKIC